jgi:hypothetical protein
MTLIKSEPHGGNCSASLPKCGLMLDWVPAACLLPYLSSMKVSLWEVLPNFRISLVLNNEILAATEYISPVTLETAFRYSNLKDIRICVGYAIRQIQTACPPNDYRGVILQKRMNIISRLVYFPTNAFRDTVYMTHEISYTFRHPGAIFRE